ncbi:MAG TPA: DNA topoisomerase IB [Roseiflexaceae bacterium]|jgi:DNA topoisomerase-1|nr:DNA topoisomerase IB [Roseiflexaceae bacterium]
MRRTRRQQRREPKFIKDPVQAAETAGLNYVNDADPGIRRKRAGKGFSYIGPDGRTIKDAATLERIRKLAIPPAYTSVWICPDPNGHIQATGRDAKGRKQYRYHPRWREVRDENKYGRMIAFGKALPGIRERVEQDLERKGMPREKVLAAVVRLLETTMIRVGNDEYAKSNHSYGLTTMHDKHVQVKGAKIQFKFRGKSGVRHTISLADKRLANIVQRSKDIPGQELFQYIDEDGKRQDITSGDVNDYLREISGQDFTAKDFRTWSGTLLAAMALQEFEAFDKQSQARKNVVQAIERVAERLGNTPSVCRKCYVHPEVLNSYLDGSLLTFWKEQAEQELKENLGSLRAEEAAVLALLQQRLAREAEAA